MSCRCKCRCCRPRRDAFWHRAVEMGKLPKEKRTRLVFAWFPVRCPQTRRWYWLRDVRVDEIEEVAFFLIRNAGMCPYFRWKRLGVTNQ